MATVKDLFLTYSKNDLPLDGGFIISSFFSPTSAYARYEVTSYDNVKEIYANEEGLTFLADGKKLYVLVEPANYPEKHIEPAIRDTNHKIPYRFKEVDIYTSKRQDKIMIGKKPVMTFNSFTVLKPTGHNFSYIFFNTLDILDGIGDFFGETLRKNANVPKNDADKCSEKIKNTFKYFIGFN